jgi:pimeloyl-ACP methyl ester carboxylesterase
LIARLAGAFAAPVPRWRARIPHQLDDLEAINRLGPRLDVYAQIEVPTVVLSGERSPAHLGERIDALARTLPRAEKVVLHRQGHDANRRAPDDVARVITRLADRVLH